MSDWQDDDAMRRAEDRLLDPPDNDDDEYPGSGERHDQRWDGDGDDE